MARFFKLALESSDLEGAVSPESTGPALNESELEENVEETTQAQAEVESGSEEIDQTIEEVDALQEQIEANDAKLENPDEVVTAVDVEVSEEAYKKACYALGIKPEVKLSFSVESVADDIRSNPRKYLAVSNEDLKTTIKKIIVAVMNMIKQISTKIKRLYIKISAKFANYVKQIDNGIGSLKDVNAGNIDVEKLTTALKESNNAELQFALLNNKPATSQLVAKGAYKLLDKVKELIGQFKSYGEVISAAANENKAKELEKQFEVINRYGKLLVKALPVQNITPESYGYKTPDVKIIEFDTKKYESGKGMVSVKEPKPTEYIIPVFTNGKAAIASVWDGIRFVDLAKDENKINNAKLDTNALLGNIVKESGLVRGEAGNIKTICNLCAQLEDFAVSVIGVAEKAANIAGASGDLQVMIKACKGLAVNLVMFILSATINQIKGYTKLVNLVVACKK